MFINERIEYLSRPLSERQAEKELKKQQKEAQRNESGVFNGVKYIFANKDTKNVNTICKLFSVDKYVISPSKTDGYDILIVIGEDF